MAKPPFVVALPPQTVRKALTYKQTNQSPVVAPVAAWVRCSNVSEVKTWVDTSRAASSQIDNSSPVTSPVKQKLEIQSDTMIWLAHPTKALPCCSYSGLGQHGENLDIDIVWIHI